VSLLAILNKRRFNIGKIGKNKNKIFKKLKKFIKIIIK